MDTTTTTTARVKIADIRAGLYLYRNNSAWRRGIDAAARDLCDDLEEAARFRGCPGEVPAATSDDLRALLLNGARDWQQFSAGGCALVANEDIAERYFPPSRRNREFRRCDADPVHLLRVQACALANASARIVTCWRSLARRAGIITT